MSSTAPKLTRTNLRTEDMVMDDREDGKDSRYYCLPPYYGDPKRMSQTRGAGGGYAFHLVSQGHRVGIFDSWPQAQASLVGFPESGNRGYNSISECIDAWQGLCVLGIHPHPVDPAFAQTPSANAACFVNTSPRKSRVNSKASSSVKREMGSAPPLAPAAPAEDKAQVLADLKRYCSPILPSPPSPSLPGGAARPDRYVNFAIRGAGIISSSPARSEQRYLELQRQGEQPDMLVTRSFEQASLFALDDGEEDEAET